MASRIKYLILTGSILCSNLIGQTSISPTYEAVANAAAVGGQYQFSGPGVIVFTTPIAFAANTALDANGHNVVFTGNGASSLIRLETNTPLTLKGLMLADGLAIGSHSPAKGGAGGAILNQGGDLTIESCIFSNNVAIGATNLSENFYGPTPVNRPAADGVGGAIWQIGGRLVIQNSRFLTNQALTSASSYGDATGGAIYIKEATECRLIDSEFEHNLVSIRSGQPFGAFFEESLPARGGAIAAEGTTLNISGGEMNVNYASASTGKAWGGAIFHTNGTLTVSNIVASHNGSFAGITGGRHTQYGLPGAGGAIYAGGEAHVFSSSFLTNLAQAGRSFGTFSLPGGAYGGAIYGEREMAVINVTFSGNASEGIWYLSRFAQEGGAVYGSEKTAITNCTLVGHDKSLSTVAGSSPVKVKNSLFAENRFESPTNAIADLGHNLNSKSEPQFAHPNSLNNAKVRLGPLGEYGGQTPVYPLLQRSVAIDAADDSAAPGTDQRGRARPYGAHSDIGAFESSAPFYIWGGVQGYVDPSTEIVMAGVTYSLDENGNFYFGPLPQGTHNAIFSAADAQFRPENFIVSATVDGPIAGPESFQLHTINFDKVALDPTFILSGLPGETWTIEAALNPTDWSIVGPFTIPSTGLAQVPTTNNTPMLFMRGSYTRP
jgi:hypothetical protein